MNIDNLKNKIKQLEIDTSSAKGSLSLLENQYTETIDKIEELKDLQIVNAKAIELLNLVQKSTKDLISDMFEGVISKALCFIHQTDDYKFELDFDRHGNVPKLSFRLKTPNMNEAHSIMGTRAGGAKDIIVLAIRLVLLEISKNKGFLFMDEAFKRLDNEETTKEAMKFLIETQKETGRQILLITHRDAVVNSVPNPIILKKKHNENLF